MATLSKTLSAPVSTLARLEALVIAAQKQGAPSHAEIAVDIPGYEEEGDPSQFHIVWKENHV